MYTHNYQRRSQRRRASYIYIISIIIVLMLIFALLFGCSGKSRAQRVQEPVGGPSSNLLLKEELQFERNTHLYKFYDQETHRWVYVVTADAANGRNVSITAVQGYTENVNN